MSTQDVSSARVYPGIVLAAVTVAVAGAVAAVPAPPLGALLASAGIWLALRARSQLRRNSSLSGWGLSLAAVLIASVTLIGILTLVLAPFVMSVLFIAIGGFAS